VGLAIRTVVADQKRLTTVIRLSMIVPAGRRQVKLRSAPMLHDELWRAVARDGRLLCDSCLRNRMQRVLGRSLRFEDLRNCCFNFMTGHISMPRFASPALQCTPTPLPPANRSASSRPAG
jgi:hypothetical protein